MHELVGRYGKCALITGASSGIGLEFARQLAAEGMDLILVARRSDVLNARAKELASEYGISVQPIVLDLASDGALDRLFDQLRGVNVSVAIMSAGAETTGHFTKTDTDRLVHVQRLNAEVPMRMAARIGRTMVERGSGALIFVSSLFGYQGVPLVANYAASKAYILSLGEALNVEMKPFGVDVLVVSPGLTDTKMPAHMPIDFAKIPITRSTPESVVQCALRALGKQATVVPGFINKLYAWQNRLVPRSWPVKLFGFLLKNAMPTRARSELLHGCGREAHESNC